MSNGQQENNNGFTPSAQHKAREDPTDVSELTQEEEPANAARAQLHIHPITTIDENAPSPASPERPTSKDGQDQQHDGAGDSPDVLTPTASPSAAAKGRRFRRSGSAASALSFDSMKEGRGIRIGAAKPTTGSSSDEGKRYAKLDGR